MEVGDDDRSRFVWEGDIFVLEQCAVREQVWNFSDLVGWWVFAIGLVWFVGWLGVFVVIESSGGEWVLRTLVVLSFLTLGFLGVEVIFITCRCEVANHVGCFCLKADGELIFFI